MSALPQPVDAVAILPQRDGVVVAVAGQQHEGHLRRPRAPHVQGESGRRRRPPELHGEDLSQEPRRRQLRVAVCAEKDLLLPRDGTNGRVS